MKDSDISSCENMAVNAMAFMQTDLLMKSLINIFYWHQTFLTQAKLIKCFKIPCRALAEEKTPDSSYKWKGGTEEGIYWLRGIGTAAVCAIIS